MTLSSSQHWEIGIFPLRLLWTANPAYSLAELSAWELGSLGASQQK